jgi:ABC-2 type transport system ATP-binding protein
MAGIASHVERPPTLAVRELTRRFGTRTALSSVSFDLWPAELVAIIGPNGAGKTTLLSILAGVLEPSGGEVTRESSQPFGWVPQEPALYSKLSVRENLRLFARLGRIGEPEAAVMEMLRRTGLTEQAGEEVARLSGGNRQRVNIALGLLGSPPVLLLDEPSSSLDPLQRERLWDFIVELRETGTAVVFSTHNVFEAERYGDRVLVLVEGELRFAGTPTELQLQMASAAESAPQPHDFESSFVSFLQGQAPRVSAD